MKMNARTKLLQFILTAAAILVAVVSINYFVDPFGYSGRNRIGYFMDSEREMKSGILASRPFDGIFLGSSKVTYFNPDSYHEFRMFNAGFGAALPEEILYLLRDTKPRVDFILLEINLFMFNEHTFPYVKENDFPRHGVMERLGYLLSLDMLGYSCSAMDKYLKGGRPNYRVNGSRFASNDSNVRDVARHAQLFRTLATNHYNFGQNGLSLRRIRDLQEIRDWAQRRNVRLVVWINPYQQEVLDLVVNSAAGKRFVEFKQMAKSVFPDVIDLSAALPEDKYYPSFVFKLKALG